MKCDKDRLIAYRDDALDPDARLELADHLGVCEQCRAELAHLSDRASLVGAALDALEPGTQAQPDANAALARMSAPAPSAAATGRWQRLERSVVDMVRGNGSGRRRAVIATAGVAVVLVLLLTVAPVRHAAAQFLSYFRVDEFKAVSISQNRAEQLTSFEEVLNSGLLGEPEVLRDAEPPEVVTDLADASAIAGFDVREIAGMPETVALEEMSVSVGPHVKVAMERVLLEAALDAAGITDVDLPQLDTINLEIDIPALVQQRYDLEDTELGLIQMPSPELTLPDGIPPTKLGEAYLQLLGLPPEEAAEIAAGIDWTSTLVIPIPEDVARYRELSVNGAPALLLQETYGTAEQAYMLLWEEDGIVHALSGSGSAISASLLARAAESLR